MTDKQHVWRIFGNLSLQTSKRRLATTKQFWLGYILALMDTNQMRKDTYTWLYESIVNWQLGDQVSSLVTPMHLQPIRPEDYNKWDAEE